MPLPFSSSCPEARPDPKINAGSDQKNREPADSATVVKWTLESNESGGHKLSTTATISGVIMKAARIGRYWYPVGKFAIRYLYSTLYSNINIRLNWKYRIVLCRTFQWFLRTNYIKAINNVHIGYSQDNDSLRMRGLLPASTAHAWSQLSQISGRISGSAGYQSISGIRPKHIWYPTGYRI